MSHVGNQVVGGSKSTHHTWDVVYDGPAARKSFNGNVHKNVDFKMSPNRMMTDLKFYKVEEAK